MPRLKSRTLSIISGIVFLTVIIASCQKEDLKSSRAELRLPESTFNYANPGLPEHMAHFDQSFPNDSNNVTDAGATLGRVLFYDQALSVNGRIACGSCHLQKDAFSDPNQFSMGFLSQKTKRNSLSIQNLKTRRTGYFWDGRAASLEQLVLMPIQDHIEMGFDDTELLVARLKNIEYYSTLFKDAFGSEEITEERVSLALAQFLKSIWSFNSKYDVGMESNFQNFTALEKRGMQLFTTELGCQNCHTQPFFDGYNHANIGLDMEYNDPGLAGRPDLGNNDLIFPSQFGGMEGMFLIPTLRNIELTAPYMHDGRYQTLEEVVDFYDHQVKDHPNLDYRMRIFDVNALTFDFEDLQNVKPRRLNMSQQDKDALIAFLKTLTDQEMIRDPKFSSPFVQVEN